MVSNTSKVILHYLFIPAWPRMQQDMCVSLFSQQQKRMLAGTQCQPKMKLELYPAPAGSIYMVNILSGCITISSIKTCAIFLAFSNTSYLLHPSAQWHQSVPAPMKKAQRTGSRYAALTGQGLDIKSVFHTSETSPILFASSPPEATLESEELWEVQHNDPQRPPSMSCDLPEVTTVGQEEGEWWSEQIVMRFVWCILKWYIQNRETKNYCVKAICTDSGFVTIPIYSSHMKSVSHIENWQICKVLAHEPSVELNSVLWQVWMTHVLFSTLHLAMIVRLLLNVGDLFLNGNPILKVVLAPLVLFIADHVYLYW